MPGCTIHWAFDTKTGGTDNGLLFVADTVSNVSWIGGTFQNDPQVSAGSPPHKLYNSGGVVRVLGNDVLIQDVTVDGYNGIAMMIAGDRVRVINPTIRNPQAFVPANTFPSQSAAVEANGAGIRVKRGDGFRCYGGMVEAGGDAAIQFSGDSEFNIGMDPKTAITDGLFQGTACRSNEGRLMLVGSTFPMIEDVRFIGITGEASDGGECIRVQTNYTEDASGNPIRRKQNPIRRVTFRDIGVVGKMVGAGKELPNGFVIENKLDGSNVILPLDPTGDTFAIGDITLENVRIIAPAKIALKVIAAAAPSYRPVRGLRWTDGAVRGPSGTEGQPMFDIQALARGSFDGVRVEGGTAAAVIALGDPSGIVDALNPCSYVVFRNGAFTEVLGGSDGVRLNAATLSGVVGGRIAQVPMLVASGVKMTAYAVGCFVEGVDVSAVTAANTVQLVSTATPRVQDLYGFDLTVVPLLGMGPSEDQFVSAPPASAIAGRAGYLRPKASGASAVDLKQISGGSPGDLLALSRAGSVAVNAVDGTALALAGPFPLDSRDDVLMVINTDVGQWAEVSRSNNG